jgi:hypothetical protein
VSLRARTDGQDGAAEAFVEDLGDAQVHGGQAGEDAFPTRDARERSGKGEFYVAPKLGILNGMEMPFPYQTAVNN